MELEELSERIYNIGQSRNTKELNQLIETTPAIDIAEALENLDDVALTMFVLRAGNNEFTAEVFAEFSNDMQEEIINSFTDKELLELLQRSFADDIADALDEFPANLVDRILRVAPKELRKDVNILLNFQDNTAGSVMTTEYIALNSQLTAKEAMQTIRAIGKKAETVYTIFVRDNQRNLVGTINLDDLIFASEDDPITEIMDKDFVCCHCNDDQEQVAADFKKYDLNAMAVLNNEDKLIGIITIDDVVDVLVTEANEDIARLNKVADMETPYLETPIWKLMLKCAPWIIGLMILQVFSTMILSNFQAAISQVAVLSVFTPLLMDAGGNSGGQTTTIIVRSLALNEFSRKDIGKVIWKEIRLALCIAGVVSVFAFCWILFESAVGIVSFPDVIIDEKTYHWTMKGKTIIALLVACTLFVTMVVSRLIGCLLPFLAKALKQDPAVLCGPITTTLVDIVSLLTYFLLWTLVFYPIICNMVPV